MPRKEELRIDIRGESVPGVDVFGVDSGAGMGLRWLINKGEGAAMARGVVKWFSNQKGYGFITPNGGGKDVFVHHSAIQGEGYKSLDESQEVEFEVTNGPKGEQASHVVKL